MLFLNKNDILQAVSIGDVVDAIDLAYDMYASNDFTMPTRMQVADGDNTLLLMPCIAGESVATKLVTVFPENKDVPALQGMMILNSRETGEVKAIMDGTFITGYRTGAIGGSAARHLAPANAHRLAVIGTGAQGLYQSVATCSERPITDIYLYNRSPEKLPSFKEELASWIGEDVRLHAMDSPDEAVQQADIIVTATTSSDPVLPDDAALLKNKLTIGIGSFQPAMREFPEALYGVGDHIFVDSHDANEESGDIKIPLENGWIQAGDVQPMSAFLSGGEDIALQDDKTILFKSTGMALFDSVVANIIYQKAVENGAGKRLEM